MNRYLFRVTYDFPDAWPAPFTTYEPVCVRADTEAEARADVDEGTQRYERASGAVKTLTLLLTVPDV